MCVDKNALFFTGDTCQTIARGVGFRFEDLTTMFFQLGEQQRKELSARGLRPDDMPKRALVQVPRVNQLSVNYRTHNGILGAASQIVSLLLELFPHSVDALEKDVGHFNGPLPTLLTDTSKDDLSILLCGSDPQHSQIEFGAHQVVLVRDQVRGRLRSAQWTLSAQWRTLSAQWRTLSAQWRTLSAQSRTAEDCEGLAHADSRLRSSCPL